MVLTCAGNVSGTEFYIEGRCDLTELMLISYQLLLLLLYYSLYTLVIIHDYKYV